MFEEFETSTKILANIGCFLSGCVVICTAVRNFGSKKREKKSDAATYIIGEYLRCKDRIAKIAEKPELSQWSANGKNEQAAFPYRPGKLIRSVFQEFTENIYQSAAKLPINDKRKLDDTIKKLEKFQAKLCTAIFTKLDDVRMFYKKEDLQASLNNYEVELSGFTAEIETLLRP